MMPSDLPQDLESLYCQLARWREDQGAQAIELGPLRPVQLFQHGYQESQRLAAPRLGRAEDVGALEGEGDSASLDVGRGFEKGVAEAVGRGLGERKISKSFAGRLRILLPVLALPVTFRSEFTDKVLHSLLQRVEIVLGLLLPRFSILPWRLARPLVLFVGRHPRCHAV